LFESKKEAYRQYDCRAEQKDAFSPHRVRAAQKKMNGKSM